MKNALFIDLKTFCCFFFVIFVMYLPVNVFAQGSVTVDTSKMTYNQISASLGLFVFPSKGQTNQQQKTDEYECYKWATQQSGIDPMNPPQVKPDSVKTGADGSAVKGAAKGALVGAAIGSVTGDAGDGAAVGAIAGGAGGMRQKRVTNARKKEQAQASAAQQQQAILDNYKKAFSACIEGKGYTIK
jgi:outer membrane lipoprotein SlyB